MSAVFDSFGARDTNVNNQSQPRDPSQPAPQGTQAPLGTGIAIPIFAMVVIVLNFIFLINCCLFATYSIVLHVCVCISATS